MPRFINGSGWLGYFLFAAIGTTIFIYAFLPSVGGLGGCVTVTPLYCASIYSVLHFPLGVAGFFVFSHGLGKHNVRVFLLLLLVLGACFSILPSKVQAQPVAVFFQPKDYYPFGYFVDPPLNVSYATATLDEYYVFEFAFFWPYHPVTFPSTCSATIPTYDWELVYVYVSFAAQTTVGVAYRFHCSWTFIDTTYPGGVLTVPALGAAAINATRPVITFISRYHIPVNDYPGGPRYLADVRTSAAEFQGTFQYQQLDYNFTQVPQIATDAHAIDPGFFRGYNWYNIAVITGIGFLVTGVFAVVFATERRKLAGF